MTPGCGVNGFESLLPFVRTQKKKTKTHSLLFKRAEIVNFNASRRIYVVCAPHALPPAIELSKSQNSLLCFFRSVAACAIYIARSRLRLNENNELMERVNLCFTAFAQPVDCVCVPK